MFPSKRILVALLVAYLSPCSLVNAIPHPPEAVSADGIGLSLPSISNIPYIDLQDGKDRVRSLDNGAGDLTSDIGSGTPQGADQTKYSLGSSITPRDTSLYDLSTNDARCFAKAKSVSLYSSKRNPPRPSASLFQAGAVIVGMGASLFHNFYADNPNDFGTIGLCGCSAVAIVSTAGVIISHISPNQNTLHAQLDRIRLLYNYNIKYNTRFSTTLYFFPPMDTHGNIQAAFFQDQITDFFKDSLGLIARTTPYIADPDVTDGTEGTLVAKLIGGGIELYINDNKVS